MKAIYTIRSLFIVSALLIFSSAFSQDMLKVDESAVKDSVKYDGEAYVYLPQVNVKMIPPAGFQRAEEFEGFIHLGSASTINVTREEGTPFIFFKNKNIEQNFEEQGVDLISMEDVKTSEGKKAILYVLKFNVSEMDFIRMILITGDYNNTIIVNGNYPFIAQELLHDVVLESMLSTAFKSLN